MKTLRILIFLACFIALIYADNSSNDDDNDDDDDTKQLTIEEQEKQAAEYLKEITPTLEKNLLWVYENNFKDKDKLSLVEQISLEYDNEEVIEFFKGLTDKFKKYQYEKFQNKDLARQILLLISRDERVLPVRERLEFKAIQEEGKHFLADAKFCEYNPNDNNGQQQKKSCQLSTGEILANMILVDDQNETNWYWNEFTKRVGTDRRHKFDRYVELYRKIAKENDFEKPTHLILAEYEDNDIFTKIEGLVQQLRPLYEQFHAYFRHRLRKQFPNVIKNENEPIPYNYLLRYAFFSHLGDEYVDYPYPETPIPDYTELMKNQNYTPQRFIEQADEFFKSMKISSVLTKDWKEFIRRDEKASISDECEPKAKTYLAKGSLTFTYCDEINFRNFYNTHAQMFIVQQYNQARNLPLIYRKIFPPAFVQALEKSMKFSVSTPAYMKKIGIFDDDHTDEKLLINRLYFLAFKVIYDILNQFSDSKYLFNLLDGEYNTTNSNCEYWKLQEKYLGVKPLSKRSNNDFDFIVSTENEIHDTDFEEIVGRFAAFNIYEGLCRVSGKYEKGSKTKPLNNCDFSGSADAGQILTKVMRSGASKPWYKIFSEITLKDQLDATSILEYFEPLRIHLENENKKNNIHVGWESANSCQ